MTGTFWLDMRKSQDPGRSFGAAPTAVWTAFRATLPFNGLGPAAATRPIHEIAATFIRSNPAATFHKDNSREPDAASRRQHQRMIANARMYSVSPEAAGLWRRLLTAVIESAGLDIQLLEHTEPKPIDDLWQRADLAAVFMCGLPFSRSQPRPELIAAPVPSPPDFRGLPQYWSEMVVRKDGALRSIEDTFGGRIAPHRAGLSVRLPGRHELPHEHRRSISAVWRGHRPADHPPGRAVRGG